MPRRITLAIALLALSVAMLRRGLWFRGRRSRRAQRHDVGDRIGRGLRIRERIRDRAVAGGHEDGDHRRPRGARGRGRLQGLRGGPGRRARSPRRPSSPTPCAAGDLAAARAAYAPSREAWERIEPIAGLIADIDGDRGLARGRLRGPGRPGVHGLAPPRVPPLREEHHQGAARRSPTARRGPRLAEDAASRRSRSRRPPSPWAPPS